MNRTIIETKQQQGIGNGVNPETLLITKEVIINDQLNPCTTCKDRDRDHDEVQQHFCHTMCKAYCTADEYGVITKHDYLDIHATVDCRDVANWTLLRSMVG